MKKLIVLIMMCGAFRSYSQEMDSFIVNTKVKLLQAKTDSERIKYLDNIAWDFQYSHPDSSIFYAKKEFEIAKKMGSKHFEAKCYSTLSAGYAAAGNYPKSLEYALSALKIYESLSDDKRISIVYNNMANVYYEMKNINDCIQYLRKSVAISEQRNDTVGCAITYSNIATIYLERNQLDSAKLFADLAYSISLKRNYADLLAMNLGTYGSIYQKQGNRTLAIDYFRKSIPYAIQMQRNDFLSSSYVGLAQIYSELQQPDSARYFAELALAGSQKVSELKGVIEAATVLVALNEKSNPAEAFKYYKLLAAAKDSLFSIEKTNEFQALAFKEKVREQDLAEEKEKEEKERRDNYQMVGIGAVIVTLIILVLLAIKKKTPHRLVQYLGLIGLLLLFEFLSLVMHPYIETFTHHVPWLMLMILAIIASVMIPAHHLLEHQLKARFQRKISLAETEPARDDSQHDGAGKG